MVVPLSLEGDWVLNCNYGVFAGSGPASWVQSVLYSLRLREVKSFNAWPAFWFNLADVQNREVAKPDGGPGYRWRKINTNDR